MQARAGAVDELIESGALNDPMGGGKDDITAELEKMGAGRSVDAELAQMKAQLAGGSAPAQIEGQSTAAGQETSTQNAATQKDEA